MTGRVKNLFSGWKCSRRMLLLLIVGILLAVAVIAITVTRNNQSVEIVYKETPVSFGSLAVGITESGSVDIGVTQQLFELDMSALQRVDTGNLGNSSQSGSNSMSAGMGGPMSGGGAMGGSSMPGGGSFNGFSQMFNILGGNTFVNSGEDSSLVVSRVVVSSGQQVRIGDVLYELEEESVLELEKELQSNVDLAKSDLEAVYADRKLSKQTAEYTYETSKAYGSYSATEYQSTISSYTDAVADAEKSLASAENNLTLQEAALTEARGLYEGALTVYNGSVWSRDHTDKYQDTYLYVEYFNQAKSDYNTVESMANKVSQLEEKVEQAKDNLDTARKNLSKAKRQQEQGILSAKKTKALRELADETAAETRDISLAYLEEEVSEQEEVYARAKEKWEEYSSHINGTQILAGYNGVITEVGLQEGDSLSTNQMLITLYNNDDVTMTVTVAEEDMSGIAVGSKARVDLIAYPEEIFEAEVTEISDATTDSKGNVVYEVTATLRGDMSGLFQGMTGEVTFISEEVKDVLYVNKRAVITEGDNSYVKVKSPDGNVSKRKITVGFSDGRNVEVLEGLNEGEIVLIENKIVAQGQNER
ncbi:MAG: efflux RND transporter periplasmic adaptor subunit [Lachnospiraceae bacterium]|nr:efflux RND transporter periplasmic adaptor subunit [Lachnospiraceae bacterium]